MLRLQSWHFASVLLMSHSLRAMGAESFVQFSEFRFQHVEADGNCAFRALALGESWARDKHLNIVRWCGYRGICSVPMSE
mmetsp:Transcript_108264/g.248279  ORF Transcript_108264/g.248279 Transcript_108264/m.248279 type:complete len:80 (-) Transcript_108264:325-564(-)